ncbi:PD-(D/E)XK nuclease-like domain-containing protein [Microbacterium sp. BG28]|uniref:PD-(D/E)XK nuclease-like domain-containing protein n=1 Tax=Microbacterium sp. BG28 TaxID=3097356 RepID=UPI002A599FBA|nr:PD-(D/E)XK nuclease-like domain-containing protein [Microbacterium sp. BG28]MDY0829070.1 PD-(D/E)XK nuclease-like domain-containing protein [Microbacterium sp. BG28]
MTLAFTGPGQLVYGMPEEKYHRSPGLSSTGAKKLLKSPAHYQHYIAQPQEPKAEFDTGSAVHSKVLGVGAQITVYPDGTGRETFEFEGKELDNVLAANGAVSTKAAKAFADEARAHGLIPVKRVVARVVNLIAESVLANDVARAILEKATPEVSMFATDPDTGVKLRGRLDAEGPRIGDLKTTSGEASESGFAQQAFRFGYDVQQGHYDHIYELITGDRKPFLFIVVESSPPYLTNVFVLDADAQRMGKEKAQRARELYAECMESGRWPGYSNASGGPIGVLKPPMWSIYDFQDQFDGEAA